MTTNETSTNEAAMTMEVLQITAEILIHVADKGSVKYGNTINSYKQSPHINKMNLQNRWNKRRISYRHWKLKIDMPTSDSVVLVKTNKSISSETTPKDSRYTILWYVTTILHRVLLLNELYIILIYFNILTGSFFT
jgi:hypothetical protein